MRLRMVWLVLICGLTLAGSMLAYASSQEYEETPLTGYGEAYDVNAGPDGALYVSDYGANQILKFAPTGDAYLVIYPPERPYDAQPDMNGDIWWTNGVRTFGYVDIDSAGEDNYIDVTSWQIPLGIEKEYQLWGLAFEDYADRQRVWMTEFIGAGSRLYRFDPALTELCTVTLPLDDFHPASSSSYDLRYESGQLWLVNWHLDRIYRLDPTTGDATWWEIANDASRAINLDFDAQGRLWWADEGLRALVFFNPGSGEMISYTLPVAGAPQGVYAAEKLIWYTTEQEFGSTDPASFGRLDPSQASGSSRILTTQTLPSQATCSILGPGMLDEMDYYEVSGALWSSASAPEAYNTDGWQIFQMPTDSQLYGIAAASQKIWIVDRGRKKFLRLDEPAGFSVFLPLLTH